MITPAFSLTATERVLPRMALDFTTATLDPRVTFTRTGNTATVVNSSGLIAAINADLPRFDYDPTTLVCKGLLIEEARSNICLQSADLNTTWAKIAVSVTTNQRVAPDGTTSMDTVTTTANNGFLQQAITTVNSTVYNFSVFVYVASNRARIIIHNGVADICNVSWTSVSANTTTVTGTATNITATPYGNGIYRLSLSFTASSVITNVRFLGLTAGGAATIGATGDFWGAQLEAGAFPTSYIPTEATTVTRNADVATMTGTNFSSWYNDSIGTFVTSLASMQVKGTTDLVIFELFNNSAKNNRRGNFINAATGNLVWRSANNAGTIVDVNVASAATANASKTACAWSNSATFIAESVNASAVASSSSASTPTSIDTLNIGRGRNDNAFLNQIISKLFFYPQTLINAELQAFSK